VGFASFSSTDTIFCFLSKLRAAGLAHDATSPQTAVNNCTVFDSGNNSADEKEEGSPGRNIIEYIRKEGEATVSNQCQSDRLLSV
jgi:hypothetical protein